MISARTRRRPLPALVFLVALSILTAIVWWRVLHRPQATGAGASASPSATSTTPCTAPPPQASLPKPNAVRVRVLNGDGVRNGLAATVLGQFKARGFVPVGRANAPAPIAGVAEVHYGHVGLPGATVVSYYLPGSVLVADRRADAVIDVVVGRAYRRLATQAQVTAARTARRPC